MKFFRTQRRSASSTRRARQIPYLRFQHTRSLQVDYDLEIVERCVTQTADISLAAEELLGEVDCLTNLTDNTVVNSLATILDKANAKNIRYSEARLSR